MEKFRTGNVVRLAQGSLVIISGYRNVESNTFPNSEDHNYKVCDYIYVDSQSMSGCSRTITTVKKESCSCSMVNGRPLEDCEDCDGKGNFMETREGMDMAKLIAPNVKSWIIDTLTNKFNF